MTTFAPAPALSTDLRRWLAHLSDTGRLAVIREGVKLEHQLAAIAKRLDGRQAVYFPRPGGHDMPVVSGFMSRRGWIAEAMGVTESQLLQRFRQAAENPLPWREVPTGRGVRTWTSKSLLPAMRSFAQWAGRSTPAAMTNCADPSPI